MPTNALYDIGKYDDSQYDSVGGTTAPTNLGLRHEFTFGATTRILPDFNPPTANERLGNYRDKYAMSGGMISATGTISEAEYNAHPTVYQQGAVWKVFDTNIGEYVFRGELVQPVVNAGQVDLSADGDGRRADQFTERFLIASMNPEMWVPGDQEPFGSGGNGYKGSARIHNDIFGNTLVFEVNRFTSFKKNSSGNPSEWIGDMRVFWAPLTPLKWISFNVNASAPDANYELQLCGTATGPSGTLDVIHRFSLGGLIQDAQITTGTIASFQMKDGLRHRLKVGDVVVVVGMTNGVSGTAYNGTWTVIDPAPGGNNKRFTANIGASPGASTSGGSFTMPNIDVQIPPSYDLVGLRVIRDTEVKKAPHRRWVLRRTKIGSLATSDSFFLDDAYTALFNKLGVFTNVVQPSSSVVIPYDASKVALGSVADDLALINTWYWRMWCNPVTGARQGEAGPLGTQTWNVKHFHTPLRPLPQRVYNKVQYEYAYGGGFTATATVTASPNPFPVGYDATFVLQMDDPPIKVIADQFAQMVANYLSIEKFAGSGVLYEVEDPANVGVAVRAGNVKPGDKLVLTNNNNVEVYLSEMSRSEDGTLIDVTFADGNPLLDRWLAERQRRINMGLSSNAATLALLDPAPPKPPGSVAIGFTQEERKKGDPQYALQVDWGEVTDDTNGDGTAVDTYHVWYRPINAKTGNVVARGNGGGWRKHSVRENRDATSGDNTDDDPLITTPTQDTLDKIPNPKDWKWEVWVRAEDLLGQLSDWAKVPVSVKPVNYKPAPPTNAIFDVDNHQMQLSWTLPTDPVTEDIGVTAAGSGSVMTYTVSQAGTIHHLEPGDVVTIAGMSVAGYNGAKTVLATPTESAFTVSGATTGAGTGGIASYLTRQIDPSIDHTQVEVWLDNTYQNPGAKLYRVDRRVDGASQIFRYTIGNLKNKRQAAPGLSVVGAFKDPSTWTLYARIRTVDQWGNFSTDNGGTWLFASAAPHRPATPQPPNVTYFKAESPGRWGKLKVRCTYTHAQLDAYTVVESDFDVIDRIIYQVDPCDRSTHGQPMRRFSKGGPRWEVRKQWPEMQSLPVSATGSGSVMTYTITDGTAHALNVGDTVPVTGVSIAGYNGQKLVASTPTTTTFTVSGTTTGAGTGGLVVVAIDDVGDLTHYVRRDYFYRARAKFIDRQGRDSLWSAWSGPIAGSGLNNGEGIGSKASVTAISGSNGFPDTLTDATAPLLPPGATESSTDEGLTTSITVTPIRVRTTPKGVSVEWDHPITWNGTQDDEVNYFEVQLSDLKWDDASWNQTHIIEPKNTEQPVYSRGRRCRFDADNSWPQFPDGRLKKVYPRVRSCDHLGNTSRWAYMSSFDGADPQDIVANDIADGIITDFTPFASGLRPMVIWSGAALPPFVTSADLAAYPEGTMLYWTVNKTVYRQSATVAGATPNWVNTTDASLIAGQITGGQLIAGAISTRELHAEAVTAANLAIGVAYGGAFRLVDTVDQFGNAIQGSFSTGVTGESHIEMKRQTGPNAGKDRIAFFNTVGSAALLASHQNSGANIVARDFVEVVQGELKFGGSYLIGSAASGAANPNAGGIYLRGIASVANPPNPPDANGALLWWDGNNNKLMLRLTSGTQHIITATVAP